MVSRGDIAGMSGLVCGARACPPGIFLEWLTRFWPWFAPKLPMAVRCSLGVFTPKQRATGAQHLARMGDGAENSLAHMVRTTRVVDRCIVFTTVQNTQGLFWRVWTILWLRHGQSKKRGTVANRFLACLHSVQPNTIMLVESSVATDSGSGLGRDRRGGRAGDQRIPRLQMRLGTRKGTTIGWAWQSQW